MRVISLLSIWTSGLMIGTAPALSVPEASPACQRVRAHPPSGHRSGTRRPVGRLSWLHGLAAAQPDLDTEALGHRHGTGDQPELALRAFGIHPGTVPG